MMHEGEAMSATTQCLQFASWPRLLGDTLPPDERTRYEQHLEGCPVCQDQLDRCDECEDAWRKLARLIGDPTVIPADPTLTLVLERANSTFSDFERRTPNPDHDPFDLYFLRPADRPELLGTLGAYEVQEVIGQGGMGVVLKAYEPALHRLVAIKVLAAAVAGSATARRRFTREAQAAAAVCHDHIVPVHGVHETDGLPYLVMQYVAGESLQGRLDRTGPLEVTETVRIALQTASGLAAAHAQGLIHRDIKPANLLLENGLARVKITDFGLARMADDAPLTQPGVVAGTPEYMAPEQARGEPVDHRADLFSLGSVIYAMCTGKPPFRAASAVAVLRLVSDVDPPAIRSLNPETPVWLETFVTRLMAKDPAERFQNAAEVATLLENYLAHLRQPISAAVPELPAAAPTIEPHRAAGRTAKVRSTPRVLIAAIALAVVGLGTSVALHLAGGILPSEDVAGLERLGAKIKRADNLPGKPVIEVDLRGTKTTDADLALLAPLTELRKLELGNTQVTGPGLRHLAPLTKLELLRLEQTPVTDEGLKDLAGLRQVRSLSLEGTDVTDAGMKSVAALDRLIALNLGSTKVTDAGLKELTGLAHLNWLALYETAITDAAVPDLAKFKQLRELTLSGSRVTDAGLKELARLSNQNTLNVQGNPAAGEVVAPLKINSSAAIADGVSDDGSAGSRRWLPAVLTIGLIFMMCLAVAVWSGRRRWAMPSRRLRLMVIWVLPALAIVALAYAVFPAGTEDKPPPPVAVPAVPPAAVPAFDVWSVTTSKDGKLIVAGGGMWEAPGEIGIWDAATYQPLQRFTEEGGVGSVAVSPDGKIVASGGWSGHVRWRDWAAGKVIADFEVPGVSRVAFSPDGAMLAVVTEAKTVQLWDVAHRELLDDLEGDKFRYHCVTFSPDGKRLLVGGGAWKDGGIAQVNIWDVATKQQVKTLTGHTNTILGLTCSHDGKLIATGSLDRTIRIWDADSGQCLKTLAGNGSWVEGLTFSPDDKTLVSGGHDQTIRFWDVARGVPILPLARPRVVRSVAFTPDGKRLIAGGVQKTLAVFDVGEGPTCKQLNWLWNGMTNPEKPATAMDALPPADPAQGRHKGWLAGTLIGGLVVGLLFGVWAIAKWNRRERPAPENDPPPPEPANGRPRRLRPPTALLVLAGLIVVGSAIALAFPSIWGSRSGFTHDFRGGAMPEGMTAFGPLEKEYVIREAEGLRIVLPRDRADFAVGGLSLPVKVSGDFEITLAVETLHADEPTPGAQSYGVGVLLSINEAARIGRLVRPRGRQVVSWDRWDTANGDRKLVSGQLPASGWLGAPECRLRLKRTGSTLQFLFAPGMTGEDFVQVQRCDFDTTDINQLRLEFCGDAGRRPGALDVRLLDLQVQPIAAATGSASGRHRGWLTAALIGGLAIGLACVVRLVVRRSGPVVEEPAPATPPEAISVQCPGCGRVLKAKPEIAGKTAKCPKCGHAVPVPAAPTSSAPAGTSRRRRWGLVCLFGVGLALLGVWVRWPAKPASVLNAAFGNQPVRGITEAGFHNQETDDDGPYRWTNGQAKLVIPLGNDERPGSLLVQLRRPKKTRVQILVNGREVFQEEPTGLPLSALEKAFDLGGIDLGNEVVVEILSNTVVPKIEMPGRSDDDREIGVQVRGVKLLATPGEVANPLAAGSLLDRPIGNQVVPGVQEEGLFGPETTKALGTFRWTNGAAKLTAQLETEKPRALHVLLGMTVPRTPRVTIKVNGRTLFEEQVPVAQSWARTFDISDMRLGREMVIEILSDTYVPADINRGSDRRTLGVCLRGITLLSGTKTFVNVPLGGAEVPGVAEDGFYHAEKGANGPFRWTNGAARLRVPLRGRTPKTLALTAEVPNRPPFHVRISIDGQKLFDDDVQPNGRWSVNLPLNGVKLADPAVVEIDTSTVVPAEGKSGNKDDRKLGLRVFRLMLMDESAEQPR
jgi:serine/threonine protein kinase/WD40 repeat protein